VWLKLALVMSGLICGLLVSEAVLQIRRVLIYKLQPRLERPLFAPDPLVGHRLNPAYPGHDSRGWRNQTLLDRADLVVFGDSQTYGLNIPVAAAWPQQVGNLLSRSVLQMAAPGYAPAHYIPLLNEALSYQPKVIVAAYYLGNDLYGTYAFAYKKGDYRRSTEDRVLDALVNTDARILKQLAQAEMVDPDLRRAASYLDCTRLNSGPDPRLRIIHGALQAQRLDSAIPDGVPDQVERVLLQFSALVAATRRGMLWLAPRIGYKGPIPGYSNFRCIRYQDNEVATVFTPAYRLVALDDTDPRISEGERISLLALQHLHERCRSADCQLYVVIIPTKETAYRKRVEKSLGTEPYLISLWQAEERARRDASQFCERLGIPTIEIFPALEAAISSGTNPYPQDEDGHPVEAGHNAIAEAIARTLGRDGFGARR